MYRTTCTLRLMYILFSFKSEIQTKAMYLMDHMDQHVTRLLELDFEEKAANRRLDPAHLTVLPGSLNIQGRTRN